MKSTTSTSTSASGPNLALPADAREVTFPSNMTAWGWMDVTQNGSQVHTLPSPTVQSPDPGCPNAVANQSDSASVNQTTQAIQCRLNNHDVYNNSGSIYFPSGTYYVNQTLSLTQGHWVKNSDGSYTYNYWQPGCPNCVGDIHISGQDPANTKIVWVGSCGTDPNIANPSTITKYNDMFYVNTMGTPFVMERLTLDGQNCSGSGIDFVSKPGDMSGIAINEMNIQNLKEVGILGDRPDMTFDELRTGGTDSYGNPYSEKDTTGMISEVTISQVNFAHVGFACVMPNAYNAVDWWIRDSLFNDCNIGVTNSSGGVGYYSAGGPTTPGLNWPSNGTGGFQVSNSYFQNSRTVDILGGNSVRNSFSLASNGPFIEASGTFLAVGNTVVASAGVFPVVNLGGLYGMGAPQLTLLQNHFVTSNNEPAILTLFARYDYNPAPGAVFSGASPVVGTLWNESYGDVASIGNQFSSTLPFASAPSPQFSWQVEWLNTSPGWAASSTDLLQCSPQGTTAPLANLDSRTFCNVGNPGFATMYNLLTFDDQLGAQITTTPPTLPPVRPQVQRNYIIPNLTEINYWDDSVSPTIALSNAAAIQTAINTLAVNASKCAANDYACPDRWGILFLPHGQFPIATTIDVPGSVQLQIVGTGESDLYWYWNKEGNSGSPTAVHPGSSAIFKLHAPSHIVMRDLSLWGEGCTNFGDPEGEGLIAEVTDLSTSRVSTDKVEISGSFNVAGIGNAAFQMRSFNQNGSGTITGNGGENTGYFAYFTGNPSNLTVGKGANLMIQDTWYEGDSSSYVTCADGDQANITIESSAISMAGWHSDANTASSLTTFNVAGCSTKIAVISSGIGRDVCGAAANFPNVPGFTGGCLAPSTNMILPASTGAQTQVLFLSNTTGNSSYADIYGNTAGGVVPASYSGTIDQGLISVDPASQAQYAQLNGVFWQAFADAATPTDSAGFAAKNSGLIQSDFIRSMLGQSLDSRLITPPAFVPPIMDMQSTDIQMEHVWITATKMDMQFVLPGAPTL